MVEYRPRPLLVVELTQDLPDGEVLFFFPILLFEGLFIRPFNRTLALPVVSCVFAEVWESEPFFHLLEHVEEERIPVFTGHFGFTTDAKPKHLLHRRFSLREPGFPRRLLSFCVHHVHPRGKGVSVYFHIIFIFLVGES